MRHSKSTADELTGCCRADVCFLVIVSIKFLSRRCCHRTLPRERKRQFDSHEHIPDHCRPGLGLPRQDSRHPPTRKRRERLGLLHQSRTRLICVSARGRGKGGEIVRIASLCTSTGHRQVESRLRSSRLRTTTSSLIQRGHDHTPRVRRSMLKLKNSLSMNASFPPYMPEQTSW
jgi:hypothetical protein